VCEGRPIAAATSLAVTFPRLAAQWHPTMNFGLMPDDVLPGSRRAVWWQCTKEETHVWLERIRWRVGAHRLACPICLGKLATPTTALPALFPEVAAEWHPLKNASLRPDHIAWDSHQMVWWQCARDPSHEWRAMVSSRTRLQVEGCPVCTSKLVAPAKSLAALFPSVAAEWHPTANGDLTPRDVIPTSHREVWWKCQKNAAHVWQASIADRCYRTGCPACANRVVTPATALSTVFPEIAAEWHPTKNGALHPDRVAAASKRRVHWQCRVHAKHVWLASVEDRTRAGRGCPYCQRNRQAEWLK
jgi:hypothetical protein